MMKQVRSACRASALAAVLASANGCGASSWVVAEHAEYPVSMSGGLRDADGKILPAERKETVGHFEMHYKACSMLWRLISFTGDKDISDQVNGQVKAQSGDAIANLNVSSGGTVWNILTIVGILPDCSSVKINGDIVKVKPVATPAPAAVSIR